MTMKIDSTVPTGKIAVKIDSISRFAKVALLVDKPDFLKDVGQIRNRLGITELIPYENIKEWKSVKEGSLLTMDDKDKSKVGGLIQLNSSILELKNKYHKSLHFSKVIENAILSGEVGENDYHRSAFFTEYPLTHEFEEQEFYLEEPMAAIFVTPETKPVEVGNLLKSGIKQLFKDINEKNLKMPRSNETIKRDRKWYWRNQAGDSPNKIAISENRGMAYYKEANEALKNIKKLTDAELEKYSNHIDAVEKYEDKVKQAVTRYKKLLSDT